MIRFENHLGTIEISQNYFSKLIGNAASSCFGVVGMANGNVRQGLRSAFFKKHSYIDKGVVVRKESGGLVVDLHIIVTFGLNIKAVVQSINQKVRYTVEEATGLEVKKVNVFVDSMKS